ncbi:glycoside hydrolase family 3 protein [Zopfochytrium polystomum]|nr:glycoside hydrolase family 3 protein [Zopfochytrium polystomum]
MHFTQITLLASWLLSTCIAALPDVTASASALARRTTDPWAAAKSQAAAVVAQLTTEEKVRIMSGVGPGFNLCVGMTFAVERVGVRSFCLQDGTTGVRLADGASAFAAPVNLAATFDKQLMKQQGDLIGSEFEEKGVDVALMPVANLARDPLAGRNWEGQGADPYLTAISAGYQIRGYLVANEQESWRHHTDSEVDDRTLREMYLRPFQYAVQKENVGAIMHSYNLLNGTHTGQNARLLTDIVKGEWGFNGFIMSDFWALTNQTQAALAGLDMLMPGAPWDFVCAGVGAFEYTVFGHAGAESFETDICWGSNLVTDVEAGRVPESRLTDAVTRILSAAYYVGLPPGATRAVSLTDAKANVQGSHRDHIRATGSASAVLVKNSRGVLPLTSGARSVAVIGSGGAHGAAYAAGGVEPEGGNLAQGGGSGQTRFPYLVTPLAALTSRAASAGFAVKHSLNDSDLATAAAVAALCDVAVVFARSFSSESGDRGTFALDAAGDALIGAVAAVNRNTVVVLNVPGPVDMSAWIDNDNVTAVIVAMHPGQESGNALVDVLYGDYNPSGRLPFTIARSADDYIVKTVRTYTFPNATTVEWGAYREVLFRQLPESELPKVQYGEGLFFDYRHFDKAGIKPLYPFGHGLSYTTFAYSNLKVTAASRHGVDVSVDVSNTGALPGNEVAQLYLGYPASTNSPVKQVKDFNKVNIKAGRTATVSLHVDSFFLPIWDAVQQAWVVPTGTYTVSIGASSGDIRAKAQFTI